LRRQYGTPVRIVGNEGHGFIQFSYSSKEELLRIADKLKIQGQDTNVSTPIGPV